MTTNQPDLSEAAWRKSSLSSGSGQNCVEVATNLSGIVAIRDSKDPDGQRLVTSPAAWRAFLTGIRTNGTLT